MVTMKDVAKAAGVSVATVSRVIAGASSVSPATQKKVMDTIEELQYCSNSLARGLRQQQTNLVAVLLRDISHPLYGDMLRGIEDVLNTNGYIPLFFNSDNDSSCQDEAFQSVLSMGVAGALVAPCSDYEAIYQRSSAQDFPTVFISEGRNKGKKESASGKVYCDTYKAGCIAAEAFAVSGVKRCIYISGKNAPALKKDYLYSGFSEKCRETGIIYSATDGFHREEAAELTRQNGNSLGVLARSNFQAVEIINAMREEGFRIPDEIRVISFENTILAKMTSPAVSVLGATGYQIGMSSAQHLIGIIQGNNRKEPVVLEPKLIRRGSL